MNDQQLIDDLKQEAAASGPAFSADLHARIMARIDAEPVTPRASSAPTTSRTYWRVGAILATAAAVVIAVGVAKFARHSPDVPAAHPAVAVHLRAAPTITNPVQSLDNPAVRDWAGTECAGVNRDANNVVAYVQRQFDILPTVR
jgi:anti-sigma-K factor RskA